jgi:AcrR family transcriptional regulator
VSERKLGRRERRVAETKERILQAAKTVFAKRGYQQATTREIAEEADVAEGSIFYHFGSKRGLLVAVIDSIGDDLLGPVVSSVPPDDLITWAAEMLRQQFALMKQNRPLVPVLMQEVRLDAELRQRYGERMRQTIAELETRLNKAIAAGRLRPINAAVVARAILGSYLSLMIPPPDLRLESLSTEEIVTSLIDLYLHGLRMLPDEQAEDDTGG